MPIGKTYRILSIDGGGVRGVYAARILNRITEEKPDLIDSVDLFAGTSTGAILAAGLAFGRTPGELVETYRRDSKNVFADSLIDDIKDLGRLQGAEYKLTGLKKVLKRQFKDTKLGELSKSVLIPAFDLDNESSRAEQRTWKPKFFHNFAGEDSDGKELVRNIVLRSCAAPIYFPSYQGYIDGGVVANNPAMAALAEAIHSTGADLREIKLLSLGTGRSLEYVKGKRHDWGLTQWAPLLSRLVSAGSVGIVDYQCRQLLDSNYHRCSTIYKDPIPMDSFKQIDFLIELADGFDISPTLNWISTNYL